MGDYSHDAHRYINYTRSEEHDYIFIVSHKEDLFHLFSNSSNTLCIPEAQKLKSKEILKQMQNITHHDNYPFRFVETDGRSFLISNQEWWI